MSLDLSSSLPTLVAWRTRTQQQVLWDQLRGVEAWRRSRDPQLLGADPSGGRGLSREQRLDAARRQAALQRERRALFAALDRQLRDSAEFLSRPSRPRVVLAHRSDWLLERVAEGFVGHGFDVLALLSDGADAIGTAVAEQPDVLVVEDRLPSATGLEVLHAVRQLAPRTVLAVHLLGAGDVGPYLQAGARSVVTRRVAPDALADQVVGSLFETQRTAAD